MLAWSVYLHRFVNGFVAAPYQPMMAGESTDLSSWPVQRRVWRFVLQLARTH
jgi:hypothetical protein